MLDRKSPNDVIKNDNLFPNCLSQAPFTSNAKTPWNKIALEQFLLPPSETPEYSLGEFLLTINIGQTFRVERFLGGASQVGCMVAGATALCPKGISQAIRWDDEAHILLLRLSSDLLNRNAFEALGTEKFELIPHLVKRDPLIYQIGLGLQNQLKIDVNANSLYTESAATFLAVHLLQTYATHKKSIREFSNGLSQSKLNQAIAYIHDNLAQDISLDAIAKHLDISRYYFCRLFKQSTGFSPYQYVIQQRVEKAKQLLIQRQLSISEIVIACGFSHQSHLNRHFKRLTGVTPKMLQNL